MSFFSKLFKSGSATKATVTPPEALSLEQLIQANEQQFEKLVTENVSHSNIHTLVSEIKEPTKLATILNNDALSAIHITAAKSAANLIDTAEVDADAFTTHIDESKWLSVCGYAQDRNLLLDTLAKVEDPNKLAEFVINGATTAIRQAAATSLNDHQALHKISKEVKGKDKNVYRIVKEKLDNQREKIVLQQASKQALEALCEDMRKLENGYDKNTLRGRIAELDQKWHSALEQSQALALNTDELAQRFQQAKDSVQAIIKDHLAAIEAAEKQQQQLEQANVAFESSLKDLTAIFESLYVAESIDINFAEHVNNQVKAIQENWLKNVSFAKPEKHLYDQYNQLQDLIGQTLLTLTQEGSFPTQVGALLGLSHNDESISQKLARITALVKRLERVHSALSDDRLKNLLNDVTRFANAQQSHLESIDEHTRKIIGLARAASRAIEQGSLKKAVGLRHAINENLANQTFHQDRVEPVVAELDAEIAKLQDYRNFAVEPKKQALIEKMQHLAELAQPTDGNENTITDLDSHADKVRSLQNEWKLIVAGGKDNQPELWETFNSLSQTAYAPCKVYFEQKADIRKLNLENRKQLISQLQDYLAQYNWESANWKDVETLLRKAKEEWSSYSPVDRAKNTALQTEFSSIINQIQAKLDQEYATNKTAKEKLIKSAEQAAQAENIKEAIEKIKQLQHDWKSIGRTHPRDNDKLWKAFRKNCDAAFDKRQQETDAFKAKLAENKKQAQTIITEIQNLAKSLSPQDDSPIAKVKQLSEQFSEIETLPKADERALQKQFKQAEAEFDNALSKSRMTNQKNTWQALFTIKREINLCVINVAESPLNTEQLAQEKEALTAKLSSLSNLPTGTSGLIKKLIAEIGADVDNPKKINLETLSENAETLNNFCIRFEIALGLETPEKYKSDRARFQIEQLKQGLMGSINQISRDMLYAEWLKQPVARVEDYDEYLSRITS